MKEVKKVLNGTDIKYNILTCGAGLALPFDTAVEVVCGGKVYGCKTHSTTKGRIGGMKAVFAENGLKEGDELKVIWDGGSRVTVVKAADEEAAPADFGGSGTEWSKPEKTAAVDIKGVRFFNGTSTHQAKNPCMLPTGANGLRTVIINGKKKELIVFNQRLSGLDTDNEKYARIPIDLGTDRALSDADLANGIYGAALSSDDIFVWCTNTKIYMTDIKTGKTKEIYKKPQGVLGGVFVIKESGIEDIYEGRSGTQFAVETVGSKRNINGFVVVSGEGKAREIKLPARSEIEKTEAAGYGKLVLKSFHNVFIFDVEKGEMTDAFDHVFAPWDDKIKKSEEKERKLRFDFAYKFYAAEITESGMIFAAESMGSFGAEKNTMLLFDGKGAKKFPWTEKSADSASPVFRNIRGNEVFVDRNNDVTAKGPDGRTLLISRTEGVGVESSFKAPEGGTAVLRVELTEDGTFEPLGEFAEIVDLTSGKIYWIKL